MRTHHEKARDEVLVELARAVMTVLGESVVDTPPGARKECYIRLRGSLAEFQASSRALDDQEER